MRAAIFFSLAARRRAWAATSCLKELTVRIGFQSSRRASGASISPTRCRSWFMKRCARPARSMLLAAATAASGTAAALLASGGADRGGADVGGRRAKIISRLLEFAGRDPLEMVGDGGVAMHTDAAFGAIVVE